MANFVNCFAVVRATRIYFKHRSTGTPLVWERPPIRIRSLSGAMRCWSAKASPRLATQCLSQVSESPMKILTDSIVRSLLQPLAASHRRPELPRHVRITALLSSTADWRSRKNPTAPIILCPVWLGLVLSPADRVRAETAKPEARAPVSPTEAKTKAEAGIQLISPTDPRTVGSPPDAVDALDLRNARARRCRKPIG